MAALAIATALCALCGPAAGSAAAQSQAPYNNEEPEVELVSTATVGATLVCYPGSWLGVGTSFKYEWLRDGAPISGAAKIEYVIKKADEGKWLSCVVIATDPEGRRSYEETKRCLAEKGCAEEKSWNEVKIAGGSGVSETPPENVEAPTISGTAEVEKKLRCSQGSWRGEPPPTYSYEWLREEVVIGSATESEYTVEPADEGHSLSCQVTARNGAGEASKRSVAVKIAGTKPKVTKAPEIVGTSVVGETLTCKPGTWTGEPVPTFSYEWLRGSTEVGTGSTYTVQEADELHTLYCKVTATNTVGQETATSVGQPILGSAPKDTVAPEISGTPAVGDVLKCSEGSWSGAPAPTYAFQWLRGGSTLVGTQSSYTVQEADETHTLTCEVTAKNEKGSASAGSAPVNVAGTGPTNTKLPEITGTAAAGEVLSCSTGSWSGVPAPTYSYEWLREGKAIPLATASMYTVEEADETHKLVCAVTATNSAGSTEAQSKSVSVRGSIPVDEQRPAITGSPEVGATLKCSEGAWGGVPAPSSYTFEWLVEGEGVASGNSFVVKNEDAEHSLTCKVTAKNIEGEATASSESVTVPHPGGTGKPPQDMSPPEVYPGTVVVGETLTCETGKWIGEPTPTLRYEWLLEEAALKNATSKQYTVTEADEGHELSCVVTATNSEGSASQRSKNSVSVPGQKPVDVKRPKISGATTVNETLTCSEGEWKGKPAPEYTFEWLLEGKVVGEGDSYVVKGEDAEHSLTCKVTAKNLAGSESASSEALAIPAKLPEVITPPEVSGPATPTAGEVLTCAPGTWNGAPAPTFTYGWVREGTVIGSASTSQYVLREADEGHSISCKVSATNSKGVVPVLSRNSIRVYGSKPSVEELPQIAGDASVGEALECSAGAWSGTPKPTFGYRWLREGSAIAFATSASYTVAPADLGRYLSCEVTATNVEGSEAATSEPITVAGVEPYTEQPTLEAPEAPSLGAILTCLPGSYTGTPTPTITYQWLRGGEEGEAEPIPLATESTYTVQKLDMGWNVSCRVIATNSAGDASADSSRVKVPGSKPESIEAPHVSGDSQIGETDICERGSWGGAPSPELKYQWLLDGAAIPGATSNKYSLEPADLGQSIACRVTATNTEGTAVETSSNSPEVIAKALHKFETVNETPGETPSGKSPPTAAQILAALSSELTRAEKGARIASLLKSGAYSFSFSAIAPGTLELLWYELPKGAHVSSAKVKPLLVAQATISFTSAAKKSVRLRLTSAGRRLLRDSRRIDLTAEGVFKRPGERALTWLKKFVLSR